MLLPLLLLGQALAITGGTQASPNDWPGYVTLAYTVDGPPECGGILLAPRVVLTTAGCTSSGTEPVVVTVGASTTTDGVQVGITSIIPYPNWQTSADLSIITLVTDAPGPVAPLALGCALDDLTAGAPASIVGFGDTDVNGTQPSTTLQEAHTTVVDPDCHTANMGCNSAIDPGGELIAGGSGVDQCFGDGGGPVALDTATGRYYVALGDRGVPATNSCGDGGIYVRIDAFKDWIESTAGITLTVPDCKAAKGCGCETSDGSAAPWFLLPLLAWCIRRREWRRTPVST